MLRPNLLFIFILLFSNFSYALDLRVLHTRPECNHEGHTSAWCTNEDRSEADKRSGMIDEINKMIDLADNPESKIFIAYLSFSNAGVFNKLCEKGKQGISIEAFFDYAQFGEEFPTRLKNECQGPKGKNINVRYLGIIQYQKDPDTGKEIVDPETGLPVLEEWRLHHNKFLIVQPGQGRDVSISFSSGNLSKWGTSLHFDHWVTTVASYKSQFHKSHTCIIDGIRAAVDESDLKREYPEKYVKDDPEIYSDTFESCYKTKDLSPEKALAEDGIYLLNSPNNDRRTERALIKEIRDLGESAAENLDKQYEIFGAIQHFNHRAIAKELNKLCSRKTGSVNVSFIMDDDIILGQSEIPKIDKFFKENLLNKKFGGKSCINIRFMETNASIRQMMHNKFIIFTGPDYARSFSGAGHFTNSAMRNNYENFYVSNNQSLVEQYRDLYNYMNKNSLQYDEIIEEAPKKETEEFI